MNISVKIDGADKTTIRLKQGTGKVANRAVFLVANFFETRAKENIQKSVYQSTPSTWYKRTGKAQQSVVMQPMGEAKAKVFMGVSYGKYLEEGTGIYAAHKPFFTTFGGQLKRAVKYKGMKARPFWSPTVKETKQAAPNLIQQAYKEYGNK